MTGNNSLMQYANYLIILTVCIDQGDGRWKERDKENLQRDIIEYNKMAEKLEHEIEAFYEEYPEEWLSDDNIDRIHYKYLTNLLNRNRDTTKGSEHKDKEKHNFSVVLGGATVPKANFAENSVHRVSQKFTRVNNSNSETRSSGWPKFDDILLAIGRKYDWKNDRWIKVKEKQKTSNNDAVFNVKDNRVDFHEKHKFIYRIVKLNRRKSRRNVVVAVSAVR